ncbi:hypothetical protein [Devosia sp.]|uniref:hypothetical protein n=1 Tax=Devosia sp. TaxID=1871048 RepID=UPI003F6F5E0E
MTRGELVIWASAAGIERDAYSFEGGHPSEALVLDQRGALWAVYYSERGFERDVSIFGQEREALNDMRIRLERIVPTAGGRDAD